MTIYDKFIRYAQLRQARAAVRDTSDFNYIYSIRSEATQFLTDEMKRLSEEIKQDFEIIQASK